MFRMLCVVFWLCALLLGDLVFDLPLRLVVVWAYFKLLC